MTVLACRFREIGDLVIKLNLLALEDQRFSKEMPLYLQRAWRNAYTRKWNAEHREIVARRDHNKYVRWWSSLTNEQKDAVRASKAKRIREARRRWSPERRALECSKQKKYREENHVKMCNARSAWRKNNPEKHREHARALGADHYLGKPYSEDELLALVRGYTTVPEAS